MTCNALMVVMYTRWMVAVIGILVYGHTCIVWLILKTHTHERLALDAIGGIHTSSTSDVAVWICITHPMQ